MSTPTFSLCHASWRRPEKAIAAARMCFQRAAKPDDMEYIFAVNDDDTTRDKLVGFAHDLAYGTGYLSRWNTQVIWGDFKGSAPAWNAAAEESAGEILLQMSDDMELPPRFDELILAAIGRQPWAEDWQCQPFVVIPSEHYRKDALLTCAICNRARYKSEGHFIFPEYASVFSDDDFAIRAYAAEANGTCALVRAPEIILRHEHAYHNPAVPLDATYQRQNSAAAYENGSALFLKRNQPLIDRGFKTW